MDYGIKKQKWTNRIGVFLRIETSVPVEAGQKMRKPAGNCGKPGRTP
jgi:hypothetical protein